MRNVSVAVVTAAATVLGVVTAAVASATPGPVTVLQTPATGTAISGLVVPSPWPAPLSVEATETPGQVRFSVPVTPEICATSIGGALVRVDFTNPGAATGGSTVINPCGHPVDPAPPAPLAHTGVGLVHFTSAIIGSPAYPRAGQSAIGGAGTFTVP